MAQEEAEHFPLAVGQQNTRGGDGDELAPLGGLGIVEGMKLVDSRSHPIGRAHNDMAEFFAGGVGLGGGGISPLP